jgi:hypothetical protein
MIISMSINMAKSAVIAMRNKGKVKKRQSSNKRRNVIMLMGIINNTITHIHIIIMIMIMITTMTMTIISLSMINNMTILTIKSTMSMVHLVTIINQRFRIHQSLHVI